jgi:hypothetical protein
MALRTDAGCGMIRPRVDLEATAVIMAGGSKGFDRIEAFYETSEILYEEHRDTAWKFGNAANT